MYTEFFNSELITVECGYSRCSK